MAESIQRLEDMKRLLVRHGFIRSKAQSKYTKGKKGTYELPDGSVNPNDAEVETAELVNIDASSEDFNMFLETGYPNPARAYRLIMESAKASIEEPYFWVLEHLRQDVAFPYVDKVTDVFSSSGQSAFWGSAQARMGIQQDRASQYLRGISDMVKQLFQLVRELRIIDEKLEPRKQWETSAAADLALKAEYTDLVENKGAQVQPGSIYHLSQSVGYAILPDLFFNTRVYKLEDVDKTVDKMGYNTNVKSVLKRKLYAFVNWKLKTDEELKNRRNFTLRYLRQHWNTIKMYMTWVKPYLRNIARLQMNPYQVESPDIVGAFETSIIELEIMGYKATKTTHHPVILASFKFRTRPELSFQQDNYQHRGPLHIGRVEITLRSYAWTPEQIEMYKRMRREEDMMLLGMADEGVKAAMEALGDDLERYLSEAGEKEFAEKKEAEEAAKKKKAAEQEAKAGNIFEPFLAVGQGFAEIFRLGNPFSGGSKPSGGAKKSRGDEKGVANFGAFMIYKNFKKSHGMLAW